MQPNCVGVGVDVDFRVSGCACVRVWGSDVCICPHLCIYAFIHAHKHTYIQMNTCVYVCMHVQICPTYVWMHVHSSRGQDVVWRTSQNKSESITGTRL